MQIKVINFYKKGPHVQAVGTTKIDPRTFAARKSVQELAYRPTGNAKIVKKPAWGDFSFKGSKYLALNAGHIYKVFLETRTGVEESLLIDSSEEHSVFQIPSDKKLLRVESISDE